MVYVVQHSAGRNLFRAHRFGELKEVLHPSTNIMSDCSHVLPTIRGVLQSFSDEDYILAMGDPVAIGICIAEACFINKGRCKILKWDKEERDYYVVAFNRND